MDAIGTVDLRVENLIGIEISGVRKTDGSDDGAFLTVEAQGDGTLALGSCRDAEALGTQTEIYATQTDKLTVVDMIDIHVTLAGRKRHVGHDTRIGNTHLRRLETIAPCHRLSLYALVGIEGVELFHRLLIEPVGHFLNGAVGTVGDLGGRDTAALMVFVGLQVHQVVVLSEDVGVTFIIHDTGVVTTVALGGLHDISFRHPRTCGGVAHGIAESLWTTGGGIGEVIMAMALIEPRTFLIVLNVVVELHDVALQGDHIVI